MVLGQSLLLIYAKIKQINIFAFSKDKQLVLFVSHRQVCEATNGIGSKFFFKVNVCSWPGRTV
jgi:hypothetical protein